MDLLGYIISYMNNKVEVSTNLFTKIYGLCDYHKNENAYYHYTGNGQAEKATDYDRNKGTLLWVKNGAVKVLGDAPINFKNVTCDDYVTIDYILRAVCVVKKSHIPCDNATSLDQAAQELLHKLGGRDKELRRAIKASYLDIKPTGYQELKGVTENFEYVAFGLDYDVQVVLKKSCIDSICDDVPLPGCDFSVTLQNIDDKIIYTINQTSDNPFTLGSQPIVDGDGNAINVPYDPDTPYVTTPCAISCDDATAVLKDTLGATISTTNIASGASQDITAPDGVGVVKNSLGTTLSSTNIPSDTSSDLAAPDATAVLKDTDGNTLLTEAIPSDVSEDIEAPDGTVTVNSAAFDTVLSGGSLDVKVEYEDGTPVGTIVGDTVEIPDVIQDLVTKVSFETGATLDFDITIDSDTAGTYTANTFGGSTTIATYEKNAVVATLPITVVATDVLTIFPDADNGFVRLTGTY